MTILLARESNLTAISFDSDLWATKYNSFFSTLGIYLVYTTQSSKKCFIYTQTRDRHVLFISEQKKMASNSALPGFFPFYILCPGLAICLTCGINIVNKKTILTIILCP